MDRRLLDREGDVSRDPGLLRECGDNDRGELEAWASRLVADVAGDRERAGCAYGSDLLRTRDPVKMLISGYNTGMEM